MGGGITPLQQRRKGERTRIYYSDRFSADSKQRGSEAV